MKVFWGIGLALVLAAGVAVAEPIKADIVWVIDDSVSMGNDISQVKANIVSFNTAMTNAGIDAQYALVRYGGPNQVFNTYGHNDHASLEQDLVAFATFNAAGGPFQSLTAPTSYLEKGSVGVLEALTETTFRAGSVKNLILITDEDDDSSAAEFAAADAMLTQMDALFNFIGYPGYGNTNSRYVPMAADHGGATFSILDFRADPGPFFTNFTATKVQEIQDAAVPEPGSLALCLLGAGALVARRRKRAA